MLQSVVLYVAPTPTQQTDPRLHTEGPSGMGAHLQGLRGGVCPPVRVPGFGAGQSAGAHHRVRTPAGVAHGPREAGERPRKQGYGAGRAVKPDVWKPSRRVRLVSAGLLAVVAAVALAHQADG